MPRRGGYQVFAANRMFDPTADPAHKLMRLVFTVNHHVPRTV